MRAVGWRPILLAAAWAGVWAGAFVLTKLALRTQSAFQVVTIRALVSGVLLCALDFRGLRRLGTALVVRLAILGLLNNIGYLLLMALALPHIPSGLAAIVSSLTPIFVMLIGLVTAARPPALKILLGILIAFAGVSLSAFDRLGVAGVLSRPMGFALAAVTVLAVATYATPRLTRGASPYAATGVQGVGAGIVLLATTAGQDQFSAPSVGDVLLDAGLAIGASLVGMSLWLILINVVGSERASLAHFLPPLFGIALGWVLLREKVTLLELLAVIPVCLGLYLAVSPGQTAGSHEVSRFLPRRR